MFLKQTITARYEVNLLMPNDKREEKSQMGRNLLTLSTNGKQQTSHNLTTSETESDPQKSLPQTKIRSCNGAATKKEDRKIKSMEGNIKSSFEELSHAEVSVVEVMT